MTLHVERSGSISPVLNRRRNCLICRSSTDLGWPMLLDRGQLRGSSASSAGEEAASGTAQRSVTAVNVRGAPLRLHSDRAARRARFFGVSKVCPRPVGDRDGCQAVNRHSAGRQRTRVPNWPFQCCEIATSRSCYPVLRQDQHTAASGRLSVPGVPWNSSRTWPSSSPGLIGHGLFTPHTRPGDPKAHFARIQTWSCRGHVGTAGRRPLRGDNHACSTFFGRGSRHRHRGLQPVPDFY